MQQIRQLGDKPVALSFHEVVHNMMVLFLVSKPQKLIHMVRHPQNHVNIGQLQHHSRKKIPLKRFNRRFYRFSPLQLFVSVTVHWQYFKVFKTDSVKRQQTRQNQRPNFVPYLNPRNH